MADHLLEVRDLSVTFNTVRGPVHAVKSVSWHLDRGEVLAILGESGSGKSVSASAILDLIDCPPGEISSGEILFDGQDLLTMDHEQRRAINGKRIAMIFQDPLSHLNPVYSVGWQIEETMVIHGTSRDEARKTTVDLLRKVGIPDPEQAGHKYPHQFSGGQRQRLMIAMALALRPDVLIADEPTTALDVTVQAQILSLLKDLQAETGMGLLIITHDLGVVADVADRVKALMDERKALAAEVAQLRRDVAMGGGGDASPAEAKVNGMGFVGQVMQGITGKDLPGLVDQMKDRIGSGVVLLIADTGGKAAVAAGVTKDLTDKVSAVDVLRAAVPLLGGKGGGGRPARG